MLTSLLWEPRGGRATKESGSILEEKMIKSVLMLLVLNASEDNFFIIRKAGRISNLSKVATQWL